MSWKLTPDKHKQTNDPRVGHLRIRGGDGHSRGPVSKHYLSSVSEISSRYIPLSSFDLLLDLIH
jgi:hypothetical protein